ncbi:MAG TPA: hypothetical protein VLM79_24605 [Kofleriaceae bacterium]|nr:hypothetical protein [Kofleriaceae bacterium]
MLATTDDMYRMLFVGGLMQVCLGACGNDLGFGASGNSDVDAGTDTDAEVAVQVGGLPCDIQTFLASNCQTCHSSRPTGGAPMPLMGYRDLTAKNRQGELIADRVLARITDTASPMPPMPAPAVPAADITMFQRWVASGTPQSSCGADPGPSPPGPFDGPTVCTSGRMWTGGNSESPLMHPGRACIACHATTGGDVVERHGEAPRFTIAGTAYPTGHEPDDCNGATSASVEITDANQKVTTLPVNAAGNFFTTSAVAFPIHVALVANGKRRAMSASPPRGDCNGCHTEAGANQAPGRITLP